MGSQLLCVFVLLIPCVFCQSSLIPTEVNVENSCLCDLTANACDVNCFCDPDCTQEDRSTFDEPEVTRINDDNACVRKELVLNDNSEYVTTENTNDDVFCLWKDNFKKRNAYRSVPKVETANEFDSYLNTYASQVIPTQSSVAASEYEPYRYNSPIYVVRSIVTVPQGGGTPVTEFFLGEFETLGPGVFSSKCSDSNQIRYLVGSEKQCETVNAVTLSNCETEQSFNVNNFKDGFKVVNTTDFFLQENFDPLDLADLYANSNDLIDVQIFCITRYGTDGDIIAECDEELANPAASTPFDPTPSLNGTEICSNVVTAIEYKLEYEGSGLKRVLLQVTLRNYDVSNGATHSFQLTTTVSFIKNVTEAVVERSGNPGFIRGKPIPKGYIEVDTSVDDAGVYTVQTLSDDPYLSIVTPSAQGSCTDAISQKKTPVKFGYNTISGCHVEVTESDFVSDDTCQSIQDQIMNALLPDRDFVQTDGSRNLFLAQFGNSDVALPGDWIEVFSEGDESLAKLKSTRTCELNTQVKLVVLYANVGELETPQAKIVGAKYSFTRSDVSFTCGPLCQANGGTQKIPARVTVNFVDVSETSQGAVKKIPPIKTDIPYDFFYPFLLDSSSPLSSTFPKLILLSSILSHLLKVF